MAEFLPPRMPDEDGEPASAIGQVPLPPDRFGETDAPATPDAPREEPRPDVAPPQQAASRPAPVARRPGSVARLISVIVSVGLAWALTVAVTAWLLGLFLARG